jgi:hypothetical protein
VRGAASNRRPHGLKWMLPGECWGALAVSQSLGPDFEQNG